MVNQLEVRSPYGYDPSQAPGIAFVAIFALGTVIHVALAIRGKYYMAAVTLLPGGIRELALVLSPTAFNRPEARNTKYRA